MPVANRADWLQSAAISTCGASADPESARVQHRAKGEAFVRSAQASTGREPMKAEVVIAADLDQEFAKRIASGEATAMREAVDEFLPQVHAVSRRMLRNEADADEVVQETFLRVWRHAGKWTPKGARLRTWVVRITMNLCYDRLRKTGSQRVLPLDEAPDIADGAPSADSVVGSSDQAGIVRAAVDGLPDRQRAAIQLVHFDEMSNIEAAEVMDVSVDALESLLARGRRSLKKQLMESKQELLGVDQ